MIQAPDSRIVATRLFFQHNHLVGRPLAMFCPRKWARQSAALLNFRTPTSQIPRTSFGPRSLLFSPGVLVVLVFFFLFVFVCLFLVWRELQPFCVWFAWTPLPPSSGQSGAKHFWLMFVKKEDAALRQCVCVSGLWEDWLDLKWKEVQTPGRASESGAVLPTHT